MHKVSRRAMLEALAAAFAADPLTFERIAAAAADHNAQQNKPCRCGWFYENGFWHCDCNRPSESLSYPEHRAFCGARSYLNCPRCHRPDGFYWVRWSPPHRFTPDRGWFPAKFTQRGLNGDVLLPLVNPWFIVGDGSFYQEQHFIVGPRIEEPRP